MKTALVFGSSGLVGGHLLNQLIENDNYNKIKIFVRSEPKNHNPKVEIIKTDFNNLENHKEDIKGDDCFFCIGTTKKNSPYIWQMASSNMTQQNMTYLVFYTWLASALQNARGLMPFPTLSSLHGQGSLQKLFIVTSLNPLAHRKVIWTKHKRINNLPNLHFEKILCVVQLFLLQRAKHTRIKLGPSQSHL